MLIDDYEMIKKISLGLILFSVIIIALAIIFVHTMPGKIARSRNHPQSEAIEIMSLLGLLVFPLWMGSLIWAYYTPDQPRLNFPEKTDKEPPGFAESEAQTEHTEQQSSETNAVMPLIDPSPEKSLRNVEQSACSQGNILNTDG